jgi:PIN domain nuclease of toxin-antitoxin system
MLLFDTHTWIWTVEGDVRRIGSRARRLIARAERDEAIRVSSATLFEIVALHTAGRLRLSRPVGDWIRESLELPGVRVAALNAPIAVDAGFIPCQALADPLDRLLVATARQLDALFLTGDERILEHANRTSSARVFDARQ